MPIPLTIIFAAQ